MAEAQTAVDTISRLETGIRESLDAIVSTVTAVANTEDAKALQAALVPALDALEQLSQYTDGTLKLVPTLKTPVYGQEAQSPARAPDAIADQLLASARSMDYARTRGLLSGNAANLEVIPPALEMLEKQRTALGGYMRALRDVQSAMQTDGLRTQFREDLSAVSRTEQKHLDDSLTTLRSEFHQSIGGLASTVAAIQIILDRSKDERLNGLTQENAQLRERNERLTAEHAAAVREAATARDALSYVRDETDAMFSPLWRDGATSIERVFVGEYAGNKLAPMTPYASGRRMDPFKMGLRDMLRNNDVFLYPLILGVVDGRLASPAEFSASYAGGQPDDPALIYVAVLSSQSDPKTALYDSDDRRRGGLVSLSLNPRAAGVKASAAVREAFHLNSLAPHNLSGPECAFQWMLGFAREQYRADVPSFTVFQHAAAVEARQDGERSYLIMLSSAPVSYDEQAGEVLCSRGIKVR